TAVNNLWLEYYVYGVVASEMGPTVPLEALKAQAVVARSTAVARIERGIVNENPLFDFVDTQMDQAYDGKGSDSDIVRRAVDLTRGEILVWDGKAVEAVYSHSCGGVISSAADMWDSTQLRYFQRKADTLQDSVITSLATSSMADHYIKEYHEGFCNPNQLGFPEFAKKNYHWSKTLSADAFNKSLDKAYGTGKIKDIAVERRSASGRVRVLRIAGEKRTVRLDREMVIRSALGGLKSTFFVIEPEYDSSKKLSKITIYGAGYGHGVGMCQIGAIMMSKQNFTYRQILGHYFMNVKIRKLYS
ncbi:SpoIID/LytB domain-containing protein, partial [Candidatus Sumerlaeota bacterium]|nr:SpoIID/LytB domain-containing protein [Candidatus Sumerlaeota bacterium]